MDGSAPELSSSELVDSEKAPQTPLAEYVQAGDNFGFEDNQKQEMPYAGVLLEGGLKIRRVIRTGEHHFSLNRFVAGADVLVCKDQTNGDLKLIRLSQHKLPKRFLQHEAKIAQNLVGLKYLDEESGWTVHFPEIVQQLNLQGVYGVIYPYYEGASGEEWTLGYSDDNLFRVGVAVLSGLARMPENLNESQRKSLKDNAFQMRTLYSGIRRYAYQTLLRDSPKLGIIDKNLPKKLWQLQNKEFKIACEFPERVVQNDLHTFNLIPNSDTRRVAIVDVITTALDKSFRDYGRMIIFLQIANRVNVASELEKELIHRGLISDEGLRAAEAGALIDWTNILIHTKPTSEEVRDRLDVGRQRWIEQASKLTAE